MLANKSSQLKSPSFPIKKVNEYDQTVVSKASQEQKRLNEEEIALLISEYKYGKSPYVLAEQFGCHRTTVSGILKKHGIAITKSTMPKLNAEA